MLESVTRIVAVGSVDGICTAATLLRLTGRQDEVGLEFCQAFTVDKVDPTKWLHGRKVAFVDLAVNNRDPSMTRDFVSRLRAAGHELVAVIDEHSREDWLGVLGTFEGLEVEPQSQAQGTYGSSGAVLKAAVGAQADPRSLELLDAADAADRMDFTTRLGGMVNQAVKSAIQDDSRRVYLACYLATGVTGPDVTIAGWINEYQEILANHDYILAGMVDMGDGIVRILVTGYKVDVTTLMSRLYKGGARIVAMEGEAFVPAKKAKEVLVAFGTSDKSLDLMAIVRGAGVLPLGGFAQKVNVALEDEIDARNAIRAALRG